jgi:hypothetical protein
MEDEMNRLKNDFFVIIDLLKKEIDELKQDVYYLKQKDTKDDLNNYNKLLSNYTPLKDKVLLEKKIIDDIEYIVDNNIVFNEMGEIIGRLENNQIILIKN